MDFNSHAHVERDNQLAVLVTLDNDFNSHAHVERDEIMPKNIQNLFISTHTLTWSVTIITTYQCSQDVFQLTRSRGA